MTLTALRPESGSVKGRERAYPVLNTRGLARGSCAPLRTPGVSSRCGSKRTEGAAPDPPHRCARG